ncbi:hypothetical protein ANTRET_LOCUS9900 [Anthophora retusa]
MKNGIWTTYYHKISIDEKPQHNKCPSGEDTWCSYQKAKASGTLDSYKHKNLISVVVQKETKEARKLKRAAQKEAEDITATIEDLMYGSGIAD